MGCATFLSEDKPVTTFSYYSRQHKKSNKIDSRNKYAIDNDVVTQNITLLSQTLSQTQKSFAKEVLKQHNLFFTLQQSQIMSIVNLMGRAQAQKGKYIFKQGDNGVCFFLILQGQVQLQVNDQKLKKTLFKGSTFGQLSLLYYSKRTGSIKAKSQKVQLIYLKSKHFRASMKSIRQHNNQRTKNLIQNVQIFSLLTNKQKYTMLNCLVRQKYKTGVKLFKKDDVPVSFYIIQSGRVSLTFNNPNKKDIVLGQLQSFGQNAFKVGAKRQGDALVIQDLICLTINQAKMKQCLGGTLSNIIYHNIKKWAIKSSFLFHGFDNKQIDQIAMQFTAKSGKNGQIILSKQKQVDSLIIAIQGKINSKPPGTIFNDQFFNKTGKLSKDLIKNQDGIYAIMSFNKLRQLMQTVHTKGSIAIANKRKQILNPGNNQDSINKILILDVLQYLTKLGQGQFGQVHLVRDKSCGTLFALKCLNKNKIIQQQMQQSAKSQRQILSSICHPLIIGFYKAYQDNKNIYFLLQYIYGMQMFQAIRQIGVLKKQMARFYFGSVLLAVQYLHSRNIIYRDLKPQNSIVDHQGKIYLIDMGTAKLLKSDNGYRTDTIIGTPHYMAPQVMQGKGYSFEADYWSLGVLFYQLICGRLPFAQDLDNPYQVYAQVMKTQVTFPSFLNDDCAKTIIKKKLLNKNHQQRGVGGLQSIRNSKYFQGFSWDQLYERKMKAPFIPKKFKNQSIKKYKEMNGFPLSQFLFKNQGLKQTIRIWDQDEIKIQ